MAIQLVETIKGYTFAYWRIKKINLDVDVDRVNVFLSLYKDRAVRIDNIDNDVKIEMKTIKYSDIDITKNFMEEIYGLVKASQMRNAYDEEGNIVNTYESNKFADAIDIIE